MTELLGFFGNDDHQGFVRQLYKHVLNAERIMDDDSEDFELLGSRYQKIKEFLSKSALVVGSILASHKKKKQHIQKSNKNNLSNDALLVFLEFILSLRFIVFYMEWKRRAAPQRSHGSIALGAD
jgi:hypothetical protein